jgi:glycerophosphoryl diester phosphodiesterase
MKKILFIGAVLSTIFLSAQTQLVAHRGFWKTNPNTAQNSIESLKNAQKLKVYGSELDVRMSKGGVLVVNHDEHINGVEVSETLFKDLKIEKLSNGEQIPTFESYLKQGKKSKIVKLIVELKPAKNPELENELVAKALKMVSDKKMQNRVEYISFSLNICKEIKKKNPKAIVQYLAGDQSPSEIKNLGIDGIDYHFNVFLEKQPTWLEEAKNLGLITNVWTVNDVAVYQKLVEMGVGFVTTDIPNELLKY